jgi:iron complex transport system substrate-binding protein
MMLCGCGLALAAYAGGACKRNTESAVSGSAQRIVSLSPSTTETLFAIGAGASVVGRSRFCNFPAQTRSIPEVGGFSDPNLEAILALRPTLVVGGRGPGVQTIVEKLTTQGVKVYFPETETIDAIYTMIQGLGERCERQKQAAELLSTLRARIASITAKLLGAKRPRVLLLFGSAPIVAAGPLGFPAELIARAGGDNVFTSGPAYPTVSLEQVTVADPDLVLDAVMGGPPIGVETPGWKLVRAIREGHYVALRDEAVLRPGPRIADGIETLARALHPERFADSSTLGPVMDARP